MATRTDNKDDNKFVQVLHMVWEEGTVVRIQINSFKASLMCSQVFAESLSKLDDADKHCHNNFAVLRVPDACYLLSILSIHERKHTSFDL